VDDRWHVIIQDAILEKCIDAGASIVHIAVDKSSSEVKYTIPGGGIIFKIIPKRYCNLNLVGMSTHNFYP